MRTTICLMLNPANEKAAYQVGAAALLPARVLRGAKTRG
jgi:hypothetical protein